MCHLRPLFASALLVITVLGGVVAPAAHWAGHGLDEHDHAHSYGHSAHAHHPHCSHTQIAAGTPRVETVEDATGDACPGCAHLQKVLSSEAIAARFVTGSIGEERAVLMPTAPSVQHNVATPEERGPPVA